MSWNKNNPVAGSDANKLMGTIRTNQEAIETAIDYGHAFATGGTQTGEHAIGSCKIYAGTTAPTTKEDGSTALDSTDYGRRLWLDTNTSPGILKVLTAAATWTSVGSLIGMLDEDDMASDSATLPASQQSIKAYSDSATQTMTNKTLTTPTINDGAVVNGDLSGDAILDEDDMASDSATKVPTQQSVKAYADTKSFGTWTDKDSLGADLTFDEVYQASCNGILIVGNILIYNVFGGITIHTDSTNKSPLWSGSPYQQFSISQNEINGGIRVPLVMPIKKDYFFEIEVSGPVSTSNNIWFLPFGSGECVKQ